MVLTFADSDAKITQERHCSDAPDVVCHWCFTKRCVFSFLLLNVLGGKLLSSRLLHTADGGEFAPLSSRPTNRLVRTIPNYRSRKSQRNIIAYALDFLKKTMDL